jgi:hypothetical protein
MASKDTVDTADVIGLIMGLFLWVGAAIFLVNWLYHFIT